MILWFLLPIVALCALLLACWAGDLSVRHRDFVALPLVVRIAAFVCQGITIACALMIGKGMGGP